jgi:putative FmdB family regulatory protein
MPIYQYVCSKCNTKFELRQSFNDESVATCPKCKAKSQRMFVPVPIIFKGSGFYVTDSKSVSPTQAPVKTDESAKATPSVPKGPESSKQATV